MLSSVHEVRDQFSLLAPCLGYRGPADGGPLAYVLHHLSEPSTVFQEKEIVAISLSKMLYIKTLGPRREANTSRFGRERAALPCRPGSSCGGAAFYFRLCRIKNKNALRAVLRPEGV